MKEALDDAREELKRVDHLIFVSLKYTRTVDVLLNVIKRLVDAYDFAIDALLKYGVEKNMIDSALPLNPMARSELILKNFKDPVIEENIRVYLLFRKIIKSEHQKINEFRRHVTLKTLVDNDIIEVNIDNITEYFNLIKEFTRYIDNLIKEG